MVDSSVAFDTPAGSARFARLLRYESALRSRSLHGPTKYILYALAFMLALWFAARTFRDWIALGRHPLSLDFTLYRASAIQGLQFGWNRLYDVSAQHQVYVAQVQANPNLGPMLWAPNVYTPAVSWIALPFVPLSVPAGYLIWSLLILAATAFAYISMTPGGILARALQVVLAFCPYLVLLSLSEGQVTSFQLAGIAACWLLLRRGHDTWAGIALTPLILKPQTMTLLPLALLAAGRFRAFMAWVIATAALGVVTVANIGVDGVIAYIARLQYASANAGEYLLGPWYNLSMHFTTRAGRYGADILVVVLMLWVVWRHRRQGPEIPMAAGLIGSLLVASYLHLNDLITLFPAAWLILRAYPRWWMWIFMAGGLVDAMLCTDQGTAHWGDGLLLFELTLLVFLAAVSVAPRDSPASGESAATPERSTEGDRTPVLVS